MCTVTLAPGFSFSNSAASAVFPSPPSVLPAEVVARSKPALAEALARKGRDPGGRALLDSIHAGTQEEIRLRAAMMASVDEGVGMLYETLERTGEPDNTLIVFVSDNGYFFGEHGLGPERRFAYEDGIRSPLLVRYPSLVRPGTTIDALTLPLDIALFHIAAPYPGTFLYAQAMENNWLDSANPELITEDGAPA